MSIFILAFSLMANAAEPTTNPSTPRACTQTDQWGNVVIREIPTSPTASEDGAAAPVVTLPDGRSFIAASVDDCIRAGIEAGGSGFSPF